MQSRRGVRGSAAEREYVNDSYCATIDNFPLNRAHKCAPVSQRRRDGPGTLFCPSTTNYFERPTLRVPALPSAALSPPDLKPFGSNSISA